MIELAWCEPSARGWRDCYPPSWFDTETDNELKKHDCFSADGEMFQAECCLTVVGHLATLDYAVTKTREINRGAGIYPDVLRFRFSDTDRYEVESVWFVVDSDERQALVDINNGPTFDEGDPRLVKHLRRERDTSLRADKLKAMRNEYDRVFCEVCEDRRDFRYSNVVGDRIYEVHHLRPLAEGRRQTRLADLAVLCACCHRAVHGLDKLPDSAKQLREKLIFTPSLPTP